MGACFGKKSSEAAESILRENKDKKVKKEKPEKKDVSKEKKKKSKNDANSNGIKEDKAKNGSANKPGSAKVRPMKVENDKVPKSIAFEINVDAKTDESTNLIVTDGEPINGKLAKTVDQSKPDSIDGNGSINPPGTPSLQQRFPRRLPKLSSLGKTMSMSAEPKTQEEIIEKQKKAEEKRNEKLEEKKQKARKFLEKFTDKNKSQEGDKTLEESEELPEPETNNVESDNHHIEDTGDIQKESSSTIKEEISHPGTSRQSQIEFNDVVQQQEPGNGNN